MVRGENDTADRLAYLENGLVELKAAQPFDNVAVRGYRSMIEGETYDFYMRIQQAAPVRQFRLFLKHATQKDGALLRLMIFARVDNPDVMADPIPYTTPTAPPVLLRWHEELPGAYLDAAWPEGSYTSWLVTAWKGQAGVDYYDVFMKVFIEGTDAGDIFIQML